jgi:hypothetical protein
MRKTMWFVLAVSALAALAGCAGSPAAEESMAAEPPPAAEPAAVASPEPETSLAMYEKPGFVVKEEEGRLWVFRAGSRELAAFEQSGEPARQVIRPAAGPGGMTIKAVDASIIDEYLTTVPGFVVRMQDGRLWIFRAESDDLAGFEQSGEPARQVIRPSAGPFGLTLKSVDFETIDAYLAVYDAM